jgi:SAM-dependent methyltransferase
MMWKRGQMGRQLLEHFLREFPVQPAIAFWRADEIAKVLEVPFPEGKGFDLGCGDGKIMRLILEHVGPREMVGLDLDAREAGLAEASGVYSRVHAASAAAIPEESETFDFVFSNCVLEHIPDLGPVLDEAARLLKPGGDFIFTVPSEHYRECMRGPLLPWVSREKYLEELDTRQCHFHYLSIAEWQQLLSERSLALHVATPYLHLREARRWETLSRFTGGLLYNVLGKRKRNKDKELIDFQWQLGLRNPNPPLPRWLVSAAARLCAAGLNRPSPGEDEPAGGLLIVAKRQ